MDRFNKIPFDSWKKKDPLQSFGLNLEFECISCIFAFRFAQLCEVLINRYLNKYYFHIRWYKYIEIARPC